MIPTVALVWVEAIEKRRYQLAKDKPVKLKLTREYLAKVRPPKKVIKHSTANGMCSLFSSFNLHCFDSCIRCKVLSITGKSVIVTHFVAIPSFFSF